MKIQHRGFCALVVIWLPMVFGCAPAVDESDPGLPGQIIDPETTYDGDFDRRTLRFTIESPRTVTFVVTGCEPPVALYDSSLQEIEWTRGNSYYSNASPSDRRSTWMGRLLEIGDYVLRLPYSCDLSEVTLGPPVDIDPTSTNQGVAYGHGRVAYRLELRQAGNLTLTCTPTFGQLMNMYLYDEILEDIAMVRCYQGNISENLVRGAYFVMLLYNYSYDQLSHFVLDSEFIEMTEN